MMQGYLATTVRSLTRFHVLRLVVVVEKKFEGECGGSDENNHGQPTIPKYLPLSLSYNTIYI